MSTAAETHKTPERDKAAEYARFADRVFHQPVPDLDHTLGTRLAMRETIERDKAAARRRRDRKELAWSLLCKIAKGVALLLVLLFAAIVGGWAFSTHSYAGSDKYYRYTCGTYACPQGFKVINPGRTISPGSTIINMSHQHWSSIRAPGYGTGSSAPTGGTPRPVGNLNAHGGGGTVIILRQWPRN